MIQLAFCHALTGIYATDPNYGKSLVNLINTYQLTLYDRPAQKPSQLLSIPEAKRSGRNQFRIWY